MRKSILFCPFISHLEDVNESGVVVERETGLAAHLRPVDGAWLADRGPEEPEGQVRRRHRVEVPNPLRLARLRVLPLAGHGKVLVEQPLVDGRQSQVAWIQV